MSKDPHDHATSQPITSGGDFLSLVASKIAGSCPQCGGPVTLTRKVEIKNVQLYSYSPELPIGDRTDIVKAKCPEHGTVDRVIVTTPAGQDPLGANWRSAPASEQQVIFDPDRAPVPGVIAMVDEGQRWHEIATEGLPPRESEVLIWKAPWCDQVVLARRARNDWTVLDARFDKAGTDDVTHWHSLPTPPAPPTKERR